ncbi:MAG TPA: NYN domain-containing protein [Solirubrobacter sp.]|nr:NYN domain-containing protein [Solirubrobacter sp.]
MTNFDTVVLFDVENLLGAPSRWKQAATELSFGDIITQLRRDESGLIGDFAVSRAYADWSRSFMGTLRREMTENGVEPRQIFAYDPAAKKNAADIELVIDALDLAYSRAGITTFVVVTRDGGFSSLGRKLHELGKAVVVCADAECSKALRAIADAFVELPAPEEGLLVVDTPADTGEVLKARDLGKAGERALDEARAAAIREIDALTRREHGRLEREGILLQTVGQVFASEVPSLAVARSAYSGLREFLQWALADTRYCVFADPSAPEGSRFRLGLRASSVADAVLPALDRRPPRVAERVDIYRLLASQGKPFLRLPAPDAAAQVLREVAKTGIRDEDLSSVINRVADTLTGSVSTADVKFTVLALAHSDVMVGEPTNAPMSDRRYTLVDGPRTFAELRAALLETVREKLARRLEIDEDVLQQLVAG